MTNPMLVQIITIDGGSLLVPPKGPQHIYYLTRKDPAAMSSYETKLVQDELKRILEEAAEHCVTL